jgi:hypothetical protein
MWGVQMQVTNRFLGLLAASAVLLSACGGGGGGSTGGGERIDVTFNYTQSAALLASTRVTPDTTGFNGHAMNCQLISGTLPSGLQLNGDCSITGIPTETGYFEFIVRVGASGIANTLDFARSVIVWGPSVNFPLANSYVLGDVVDSLPTSTPWTAERGDAVVYSIASGSLPDGVSIDPADGHISGKIQRPGSYSFQIQAELTSGGRRAVVSQPSIKVIRTGFPVPPGYALEYLSAWMGLPVSISPVLPPAPGVSYALDLTAVGQPGLGLPAGLSFDSTTGAISGTATEAIARRDYTVDIYTIFEGSVAATTSANLAISVTTPDDIRYSAKCIHIGPCFIGIMSVQNYSGQATYTFSGTMPEGLELDLVTGQISGSRTAPATSHETVTITIKRDTFNYQLEVPFS